MAIALRLPGVFWGHVDRSNGVILEPDEFQHITVAADYLHRLDDQLGRDVEEIFWNSRAFGVQLSVCLYVGAKLGFTLDSSLKKVLIGRMLSVLYSLILLWVVYQIGLQLFGRAGPALWSTLCLAVFDLNVTMSHYALPEMMYNCCLHLAILGMLRWSQGADYSRREQLLTYVLLCVGGGWTLGAKLDFLPFFLAPAFVFMVRFWRTRHFVQSTLPALIIFFGSILAFFAAHLFYYPWEEMLHSYRVLTSLNQDVIASDQHWLYNPLLYFLAVVAGTSLPLFLLLLSRLPTWISRFRTFVKTSPRNLELVYFLLLLALEFGVRWSLDTPFVRRADIFLPAIALAGGYALWQVWEKGTGWKKGLAVGIVLYTLGITLVNQSNFWQDTRYEALAYLQQAAAKSFHYSTYAYVPGMPREGNHPQSVSIHIMHESHYSRYWKFFTTPFRVPACCEEVYNCWSEEDCKHIQSIFRGETDYQLLAEFKTRAFFPERILFKSWFGTYETFLGDVRIYSSE